MANERTMKVSIEKLVVWEQMLLGAFLEMTDGIDDPADVTGAMRNVAEVRAAMAATVWDKAMEPLAEEKEEK